MALLQATFLKEKSLRLIMFDERGDFLYNYTKRERFLAFAKSLYKINKEALTYGEN